MSSKGESHDKQCNRRFRRQEAVIDPNDAAMPRNEARSSEIKAFRAIRA
jgi:hypothetical protein